MTRFFIVLVLSIVSTLPVFSQVIDRPVFLTDRLTKYDQEIIQRIHHNFDVEDAKLTAETSFYRTHLTRSLNYILTNYKEGAYLKHDSLQVVIDSMAQDIIRSNNLELENSVFLIKSSGYVNAMTTMINVFEIDVGLFGMLNSKDELAFVLSHEIVHQLNYHIAERIALEMEYKPNQLLMAEMRRITNGLKPSDDFHKVQGARYELMRKSRNMEVQADSIGLIFMEKAGYSPQVGVQALYKLGYRGCRSSKDFNVLFSRLFTPRFTPKENWFVKQLPLYSKYPSHYLIYNVDSLISHPHLEDRIKSIEHLVGKEFINEYYPNVNDIWQEMIWSGYEAMQADLTLFYLLIYLDQSGYDAFAGSMVASIFLDLYWAKFDYDVENNIYQYVNHRTVEYPDGLRNLNNVLLNMSKEDCLETGFYFLSNREVFDSDNEDHYFLLYQYAALLEREEVANKVRSMYFSHFTEGKYRTRDFK
ncbi:MAG: hypothetical protein CMB80_13135 [Flammeovirgaceae bacterium]|nr:hypothetical protein [Flammeovirgaceae bacterium]HCX22295.1 hypothetical protein [Cytophagales bacterium]